jgi:HlyD family secretion protein
MTQPPGVRRVSVEVGVHNEDYIEIVSGLAEGDTVIVPGAASDGSRQAGQMARPGGFGGAGFPQGGFSPGGSPGGGGGFPGGGGFQGGQGGGGFGGSARGGGR